jgi:hypothetical protein
MHICLMDSLLESSDPICSFKPSALKICSNDARAPEPFSRTNIRELASIAMLTCAFFIKG